MFIRWHGYSCFEFADDKNKVIIDPHDGKSIGVFPPKAVAKLCLCTHNTFDRNAFRAINGKHKDVVCSIGPQDIDGFRFEGLPSFSDEAHGKERGQNAIYLFEMDGVKVAFCGCLGDIPDSDTLDRLADIDIMFVPVGEHWTMPIYKVNEFLGKTRPKVVVPTDFRIGGITLPLSPLSSFTDGKPEEDIVHVGNAVELEADDIAEFTGIWVFDR